MSNAHPRFAVLAAAVGLVSALAPAGEAPPKPDAKAKKEVKKAPPKGPKTHKVKRGPFRIEARLDGVFEAHAMAEVVFRPEAWSVLAVKEAARHGAQVKAGEVVLALDTEKIDEAIEDAESGRELADLGLALAKEEEATLEKTAPLDLAAAGRASRHADEDLKQYEETGRALWIKQTNQSLKNSERYLAYQLEELRQLEKMYQADDLTEETEEIILARQRHAVERARLNLEAQRVMTEKTLRMELPRRDVSVKEAARRKQIGHEKARVTLPGALRKKRLEIEAMERARRKSREKLDNLRRDREAMIVRAPVDGIVYCGRCVRGQWTGLGQVLSEGTTLKPHAVVMTILEPRPVLVRTSVPEKFLALVRPGLAGKV
ncbi:MAG: HlyD family secretion protein, partial [Planctomycetota bacterium]